VHHLNGIQWQQIIDRIYKEILCDPKHLMVLCKECHKEVHERGEL
jgi:predicted metal-binding protein